jgi:hypothetical protein
MKIVQDTLVLAFDVTFSFSNFTLKKGRLGGKGACAQKVAQTFHLSFGNRRRRSTTFPAFRGSKKE